MLYYNTHKIDLWYRGISLQHIGYKIKVGRTRNLNHVI